MKIELLKLHTHAGTPCHPGAVIALDDDLARWLVETGVARAVAQTHPAQPPLKPNPHSPIEEKSQ